MLKKLTASIITCIALISSSTFAQNTDIKLSEPIEIPAAGKAELFYMSAADYNGDQVLDLVVGNFKGVISVKINSGTKSAPLFNPKINLKADGKDIVVPHW